jgi:hypothetical protein
MEKKEVTIEKPVTVGELTLVPVVQVLVNHWRVSSNTSFFSVKQPVAVIVISPLAKRAFRVTGGEVSLDQLIQEMPVIGEMLERV